MTREEREEAIRCLSVHSSTNGSGLCTDEQHNKAKQVAIQALENIGHLKDRPCDVCEFRKENGCCKWDCVFD